MVEESVVWKFAIGDDCLDSMSFLALKKVFQMNLRYRFLIGLVVIFALVGMDGCMSQELKTALSTEDAQVVSQLVQTNPNDISGASLKNYTLRGLELHDLTIKNVDMYNLDLQGAKLTNITFEDCTLTGVDFSNSEFHNVRFMDTTLEPIGSTPYDEKVTTFKSSLFDKVGFGEGSKLLDVEMHFLKKGSSIAIVECKIAAVVEGNSLVFYKSNLDNLLIDRTDVGKEVTLSFSILGAGNVVIKNSSLKDVDLYGLNANNLILENNRDSLLRVGGEIENVKIVKNSKAWISIDGNIAKIYASDNSSESDLSFGGEIDEVIVKDCDGLSIGFVRAKIASANVLNCNRISDIEWNSAVVEDMCLSSLDINEINFFETSIKKLSIKDVELKKRSWIKDSEIAEASVENLSILPTVKYEDTYKDSYKETEVFWNGLLSQQ
ncbi:pentapeptide repeat-containing protein [Halodesulfovibrio sp. MK-HDV]|uniref:pentapeptide repeat-containing protein n=1 Tax=Halodesulfovibrio sp. MK-HDV TaxID=2599925 RepID=UPI00136FCA3D|nr:pentapeptide repeat-containing protein [Halodesulfovibrio sp. MK-HDV]KAF1077697.1 hypothetical protein MKHDV_00154 [Halodesulfovibrio sp. MK-HDV]